MTIKKYTRQLIYELQLRDVPGDTIGEVIAQVESHIAETGEDPVVAFGRPREYAAQFGTPDGLPRRWPLYLLNWVVGAIFGCILIIGVMGQVRGVDSAVWGLSPLVLTIVGALGLVIYFGMIVTIGADRVKDPRDRG